MQAALNDCKINVLPDHQGRIGGHSVQDPQIPGFLDLGKVGCVDEEFHDWVYFITGCRGCLWGGCL